MSDERIRIEPIAGIVGGSPPDRPGDVEIKKIEGTGRLICTASRVITVSMPLGRERDAFTYGPITVTGQGIITSGDATACVET